MFFNEESKSALDAIEYGHLIAYAPIAFQATRSLRNLGILDEIIKAGREGITLEDIVSKVDVSHYGVRVLVEAGLGIGLILENDGKYTLTKTGIFIMNDKMTRINMDFVHDVCYEGMFYLEESILNGKPEGLKVFGEKWNTIYEALSSLPSQVQKSWFAFDHYYSDDALAQVLPLVFKDKPAKILDIGGNTGKWSLACMNYDKDVRMGIVDLPGQINMAKKNIESQGFIDRVSFHELNILNEDNKLPKGYNAIWMSQFLDCFSEAEIVSILKRCYEALTEDDTVYILEPFWNRQRFKAGAFSLQQTSLYFTALANGNSQMYHSDVFIKNVLEAGFEVKEIHDRIGISQTLLKCKKK
ncbi:MAG: SAM-dependent methyltransferase [Brumimicrobium sp.]|nr:SAM-dependent methyltransferase [Brumimicrobium sp.]